ncbi:aspartate aminotransferase family protein [Streptomyces sp. bgisy034]|uniref:aminotransferase family protein n=1 Tax=Streptomyces sp. bgisy034 TaxID=3413774 RepID=UPI003EB9CCC7
MAEQHTVTGTEQDGRFAASLRRDRRFVWHGWAPLDRPDEEYFFLDRGDGWQVWDNTGKHYVDAVAAAMNSACGYGHPRLLAAAQDQLRRLPHFDLSVGGHEAAGLLAEQMAALLPGDLNRTHFTNSGSEAAEAAVRIAVNHWQHKGADRHRIISFASGYHGTTALAQSLSGLPAALDDVPSALPVTRVPLPMEPALLRRAEALPPLMAAFRAAFAADGGPSKVAAVLVEPFLNVGGGILLPEGFLRELRELCDETGALLILDEVFTGFGRTGQMFGFQHDGVVPDIVMTSKALSSGYLPIGAVTVTDTVFESFRNDPVFGGLRYGHTTSGHATACAVALATLDVIASERLVDNAVERGRDLIAELSGLADLPGITDVRGLGLIGVVETAEPTQAQRLLTLARDEGLLLRCQGRALLAVPPLTIDAEGIQTLADRFCRAAERFTSEVSR